MLAKAYRSKCDPMVIGDAVAPWPAHLQQPPIAYLRVTESVKVEVNNYKLSAQNLATLGTREWLDDKVSSVFIMIGIS